MTDQGMWAELLAAATQFLRVSDSFRGTRHDRATAHDLMAAREDLRAVVKEILRGEPGADRPEV